MLIDWFTTAAQIVNFLILVWLLRKFLYGPVIGAMDKREEKIAKRLKDAEEKEQQAMERKEEFEDKTRDLEKKQEELMEEAREKADERRKELVKQARDEADKQRAEWEKGLRREKETFLRDLQQHAAGHTCSAIRNTLAELADAGLEKQIVSVWRDRLDGLDKKEMEKLRQAAGEAEDAATMRSAFELDSNQRRELTRLVHQQVDKDIAVEYQTDEDLVCGIELRVGGYKLAWSVADHLESLRESVGELIDEEAENDESKESQ